MAKLLTSLYSGKRISVFWQFLFCSRPTMKLQFLCYANAYPSPTNWDKHFDDLMARALKRMHILRVCKINGCSVSDLDYLFNCLIMSIFTYCIRVWGVAAYTKYLSQIDRLLRRAFRFGYIQHESSIQQVIIETGMWGSRNVLWVLPHVLIQRGLRNAL